MEKRITAESAKKILKDFFEGDWSFTSQDIDSNSVLMNGVERHLFLVGQTKSFEIESERGHLWAPNRRRPNMKKVKPGDIIISYKREADGWIKSVNVSLSSAEGTYGWPMEGLQIYCYYSVLEKPVDIEPFRTRLAGYTPFSSSGDLPMSGYIHPLHSHAARIIMDEVKKAGNTARL